MSAHDKANVGNRGVFKVTSEAWASERVQAEVDRLRRLADARRKSGPPLRDLEFRDVEALTEKRAREYAASCAKLARMRYHHADAAELIHNEIRNPGALAALASYPPAGLPIATGPRASSLAADIHGREWLAGATTMRQSTREWLGQGTRAADYANAYQQAIARSREEVERRRRREVRLELVELGYLEMLDGRPLRVTPRGERYMREAKGGALADELLAIRHGLAGLTRDST